MDLDEKIMKSIDSLRQDLAQLVKERGRGSDSQALELSQKLDGLLRRYRQKFKERAGRQR